MKASCRCRKIVNLGLALMLGVGAFASSTPVYAADNNETASVANQQSSTAKSKETKSGIYQDTTEVKNRQYKTVGEMSQYMADHNALGVAGEFHLFGNEVTLSTDTNGNIAANKFDGGGQGECGTRNGGNNATDGDLYYLHDVNQLGDKFRFRNENGSHLVLNKETEKAEVKNDSSFTIKKGDKTFSIEKGKVTLDDVTNETADHDYLDINSELTKLSQKSNGWFNEKQSEGVKSDFSNENNRWVDVSGAKANSQNLVFVNVPAKYLEVARPIKVKGLAANQDAKTIIINVVSDKNSLNIQTQTKLIYDNNQEVTPNEQHAFPNRLLWNFGTSMSRIVFRDGYFTGSVLATKADVEADENVDGNIVADKIEIKGETHRWDLTPDADFAEDQPDKGNHDQPETPSSNDHDSDNPNKDTHEDGKTDNHDSGDHDTDQDKPNKDEPSKPDSGKDQPTDHQEPEQPQDWEDIVVPGQNHENHETPSTDDNVPEQPTYPDEPDLKPKHEDDFFKPIENHDEKTVPSVSTKTIANEDLVPASDNVQPKSHQTAFKQVSVSQPAHPQSSAAKTTNQTLLPQTNGQNILAIIGFAFSALAAGLYLSARKHN